MDLVRGVNHANWRDASHSGNARKGDCDLGAALRAIACCSGSTVSASDGIDECKPQTVPIRFLTFYATLEQKRHDFS